MIEVLAGRRSQPGRIEIPVAHRPSQPPVDAIGPRSLDERAGPGRPHFGDLLRDTVGDQDHLVSVVGKVDSHPISCRGLQRGNRSLERRFSDGLHQKPVGSPQDDRRCLAPAGGLVLEAGNHGKKDTGDNRQSRNNYQQTFHTTHNPTAALRISAAATRITPSVSIAIRCAVPRIVVWFVTALGLDGRTASGLLTPAPTDADEVDQLRCTFDAMAEQRLQIEVRDTGPGISPEDVSQIFDRYYRAQHAVGDDDRGAGLGLAIAKRAAELLGGSLNCESEIGRGTTFRFELPAA